MKIAQILNLPGGQQIVGPLPADRFPNLASVVTQATNRIVFPVAGVFLLLYLVWGGFDFLTSMGDPKKAESGKNKITNALLGFILIFVAYWIVQIAQFILKIQ